MKNDIRITYPTYKYKDLNNKILEYINSQINNFLKDTNNNVNNLPYSLYIYYDTYEIKDSISILFYTSIYTGGAHPDNSIYTINYNKIDNSFITIDTLVNKNPNILNLFSYQSRKELGVKKEFQDPNIKEMLIDGTKPVKDNFKYFVLTKDGIILCFPPYQIAPYYMGVIQVLIK